MTDSDPADSLPSPAITRSAVRTLEVPNPVTRHSTVTSSVALVELAPIVDGHARDHEVPRLLAEE